MTAPANYIIAVTGMLAEARIAERAQGVKAIAGGGDCARLAAHLERAIDRNVRGILSFGIAGGLAPSVKPGDIVVADAVVAGSERYTADTGWTQRLAACLPDARLALIASSEFAIATSATKAELYRASGAIAVDMESHVAARAAAKHGLPFAVLRVVADHAGRALPPAALAGLGPGGAINIAGVLKSLARQPSQLPQLLRVSADTNTAMKALLRSLRTVSEALGPGLGAGLGSADLG